MPRFSRTTRLAILFAAALASAATLWPADASAQHRGRGGRGIIVRGGFYGGPFFYDPFWGYNGWYPYGVYGGPYGYYPWGYDTAASIRIQATPKDAQVYVDGYFVGIVDDFDGFSQRLRLVPGEHEIVLYLTGYQPVSEKMLFRRHASYKVKHELVKLTAGEPMPPKPVPVEHAKRPVPDAGGDGPMAVEPGRVPPQPGDRDGMPRTHQPADQGDRDQDPDRDQDRDSNARAADFGTLAVRVQPADAIVTIDGERWDAPAGDVRLSVQLAGGTHRVEIRKDGFKPYSTEVRVRPGETTRLNVSLPQQ